MTDVKTGYKLFKMADNLFRKYLKDGYPKPDYVKKVVLISIESSEITDLKEIIKDLKAGIEIKDKIIKEAKDNYPSSATSIDRFYNWYYGTEKSAVTFATEKLRRMRIANKMPVNKVNDDEKSNPDVKSKDEVKKELKEALSYRFDLDEDYMGDDFLKEEKIDFIDYMVIVKAFKKICYNINCDAFDKRIIVDKGRLQKEKEQLTNFEEKLSKKESGYFKVKRVLFRCSETDTDKDEVIKFFKSMVSKYGSANKYIDVEIRHEDKKNASLVIYTPDSFKISK